MAHITYFPRYTTKENVVTNTTLHLFSQINYHSSDRLRAVLSELLGDVEMPLGINFQQQIRSSESVPDGEIVQEPIHLIIETKVGAPVDAGQLIRHCERFTKGSKGNYLVLLTKEEVTGQDLDSVRGKAKEIGAIFQTVTFEKLCLSLQGLAKEHETYLVRITEDYAAYCTDMELLPDRRKWLRIVPCGRTFDLNKKWHLYYQPTDRGYSAHEYLGIYNHKSVRLLGEVSAIYDSHEDSGQMQLNLVEGDDRPDFRQRIEGMVADSKQKIGWDLSNGTRFFCADQLLATDFRKTSWGGIQGARFWDISEEMKTAAGSVSELADLLRHQEWQ